MISVKDYFIQMIAENEDFHGRIDSTIYLSVCVGAEAEAKSQGALIEERFDNLCSVLAELCSSEGETVVAHLISAGSQGELAMVVLRVPQGQSFREASRVLRRAINDQVPAAQVWYLGEQILPCLGNEVLDCSNVYRSWYHN